MNISMKNNMHLLYALEEFLQSIFSSRLIPQKDKAEQYRKSFLPADIRLFDMQ